MQIVIDIVEDTYEYMRSRCEYQNKGNKGLSKFEEAGVAIKNGTPLPKGHGDLKDADEMKKRMGNLDGVGMIGRCIDEFPTIIEADKVESEEVD